MAGRNYSGSAQATTLAAPLNSSDTTFTVAAAVNWPSSNFIITLDAGTASEEKVLVGSRSGTTCNSVTRGYDDTAALSHLSGASARHTFSAVDAREANTHVNATTGVHGVTGSVVGTGGAQTLTGKTLITPTLTTPTMSNPTITGTPTIGAGSIPQAAVSGLTALSSTVDTHTSTLSSQATTLAGKTSAAGTETVSGQWTFTTRPKLPRVDTAVATGDVGSITPTPIPVLAVSVPLTLGHTYRIIASGPGCFSTVIGDIYQMSLLVGGTQVTLTRGHCDNLANYGYSLMAWVNCVLGPSAPYEVAAGISVNVQVTAARHGGSGTLTHAAGTGAIACMTVEDMGV